MNAYFSCPCSEHETDYCLASFLFINFAAIDRYCKLALVRATQITSMPLLSALLSSQAISIMRNPIEIRRSRSRLSSVFTETSLKRFRHRSSGTIVHLEICAGGFLDSSVSAHSCIILKDIPRSIRNMGSEVVVDDLTINSDTTIWIYVNGRERPFDATGHYPIFAGFSASGESYYVALAEAKGGDSEPVSFIAACVANKATAVTWTNHLGETELSQRFYIAVLRRDPVDFPPQGNSSVNNRRRIDPTGPLFWNRFWPDGDRSIEQPSTCSLFDKKLRYLLDASVARPVRRASDMGAGWSSMWATEEKRKDETIILAGNLDRIPVDAPNMQVRYLSSRDGKTVL